MIEISPKVSATLTLRQDRGFRFFDLPPVIVQLLTRAGVHVYRVDLAFEGNSARYETDQGTVSVTHAVDARGTERLVILCDTLRRGSREVGRQICYELVRRLIARCRVATVHWRASRQTLLPEEFRWAALADLPQRFTCHAPVSDPWTAVPMTA